MALWTLIGLAQGKASTSWPRRGEPDGQEGVLGMPRHDPAACRDGCHECADACPTQAITVRPGNGLNIDYGQCVVCQLCTEACPTGALIPSSDWAFGVAHREDLVWAAASSAGPATAADRRRLPFRRSLHIRHVDAGSCNGCESELQALNNPFYNLHRLGIFFTPSPRFADLLLVTGPVAHAMLEPLRATYAAMPEPRWVMAVGTCAVAGGIAGGGYACGHGLEGVLPVDVFLPGCPPNPAAIIAALLMFLGRAPQQVEEGALANELLAIAALLWVAGGILALIRGAARAAQGALVAGGLVAMVAAIIALPDGTPPVALPGRMAGEAATFRAAPEALWLMGFGLVPAILACWLGTPARAARGAWCFGAALSLLGALGVFGLQHGGFFLLAWELMSLGGAVMILGEGRSAAPGMPVLFMLGLLEVGAVALLIAVLLLGAPAQSLGFAAFAGSVATLPVWLQGLIGVLLVIGFGAKLGLLPFYEWFPGAYGAGSGASGAIMSGMVLNAAFFGLSRGLLGWLPAEGLYGLGIFVVAVGVLSAILAVLYAFQQEDWRALLSFSSAENAAIAVAALGAAMLFRDSALPDLAGLAWTVALLHLAGHALAKGALFLTADGVLQATGSYAIGHALIARRSSWIFGVGALFAAMSLAAMPPQAGFVSEWFVFQTVFQGFHLPDLAGRLTLALAGAGLALTAAVAFATFVKVLGIGLLGGGAQIAAELPGRTTAAVGILGASVLALAVGMPAWLAALAGAAAARLGSTAPQQMHDGLLLVPLTAKFAFISPSMLVIAMPLLALLPAALLLAGRRHAVRRVPVWYGGSHPDPRRTATTALTFSNALRTFYSFIYRPRIETTRESRVREYFVTRLVFTHDVAPVFGPYLFAPAVRLVRRAAERLRPLQSGHLNFYLALIGLLLVVILGLALWSPGG